jgi:hypothetical protein
MRRSICTCEPAVAYAGDIRTWKFHFTTATALPEGTVLLFDIDSMGRPIDWETPTVYPEAGENVIWAQIEGEKPFYGDEIEDKNTIVPKFQFILPMKVPAGKTITLFMGDPKEKKWTLNPKGTQSQTTSQRRRPFYLYVDPTGKGKFDEPEAFSIDVKGNILHNVKIVAPSFVAKNKRFDVVIRFEDEFGNLTSNTEEDETLIELSHEHLRENLNWKLFIPETGYITLPNLYFNEVGVYTITLTNLSNKEQFKSSPIRCTSEVESQLFWGTFHGESERVDSTENIDSCLRHFRDEQSLNFYGASPFESNEETPNDIWRMIAQNLGEFNEEDRFATFAGCQWHGEAGSEGLRQFVFLKEQKQLPRKKDTKYGSLKKVYKAYSPKELISIPSFTMGKGMHYDFKEFNPEFERVAEIYNAWGCSERTKGDGNLTPIEPTKKSGISETKEGALVDALIKGCRFGFVSGGLDDRGSFESFYDSEQSQYPPGITGIVAPGYNRDSIFDALYNRRCYATTGERMILGIEITGDPMGSEISLADKPGLQINRHITVHVAGTKTLHKVELIRNGEVIKEFTTDEYHLDFTYDDMTPLSDHALKSDRVEDPFTFYYIRATQTDGHMAWSSPIWIDHTPPGKKESKKAAKPVKKATK